MCFSSYLTIFFEAITSKKPLYTTDLLRPNFDSYIQAAFIEMQAPLAVQKALERAFSKGWTLWKCPIAGFTYCIRRVFKFDMAFAYVVHVIRMVAALTYKARRFSLSISEYARDAPKFDGAQTSKIFILEGAYAASET